MSAKDTSGGEKKGKKQKMKAMNVSKNKDLKVEVKEKGSEEEKQPDKKSPEIAKKFTKEKPKQNTSKDDVSKAKTFLKLNQNVAPAPMKVTSNKGATITGRKMKETKSITKTKKDRKVADLEKSGKVQSTLTQHFPIRRSERKTKVECKNEERAQIVNAILSCKEDGLEVKVSEEKGRGVFSTRALRKGDFVCEYAGELIPLKEAREREAEYATRPEVGSYMYFFKYKSDTHCVDATKETGRLGRLLNHSKTNSNVCTKLFAINNTPHLILVARKDIERGDELVYDYGDRSKMSIASHPWLKG